MNEKKTDAQGSAADPTPDDRLAQVAQEIVVQQTRNGIQAHQGKLVGVFDRNNGPTRAAETAPAATAAGGQGAIVIVDAVPRRGGGK